MHKRSNKQESRKFELGQNKDQEDQQGMTTQKQGPSVLQRTWHTMLGSAVAYFVVFQAAFGVANLSHMTPMCPHTSEGFPFWYFASCYSVLGGFMMIWLLLVVKVLTIKEENKRVPIWVALGIVTMATISTILGIFDWGGVCIDVLGVGSPASIWAEWTACGPLLIYITVTIVDKPFLTKFDWFIIITFYLCLITGFFIIPQQPVGSGQLWLAVSCLTYIPSLYLPCYSKTVAFQGGGGGSLLSEEQRIQLAADRYDQQQRMAMWLTITFPLYTVNYLVATWGGIDVPTTIVIYQILSLLTKGLFAAVTMDIHLDLIRDTELRAIEQENRVNAARRAFMRYHMHAVVVRAS